MNKADALMIFATAIMREILREDDGPRELPPTDPRSRIDDDPNPRPQFDFDESTCEHGGLVIERAACPIHGPGATGPAPTAEELDDITSETHEEANPLIARARRKKALEERQRAQRGLYAEDIPMSGLATPPGDPPLIV
jgi:hypothetical protein